MVRKPICGIYKVTNLINGKIYIGQSIDILDRWKEHKNSSFNSKTIDYNCNFHQAIRKYGLENFIFEILEECSRDELNLKEKHYISIYESYPPSKNKGYNQTPGGEGCLVEKKISHIQLLEIFDLLKNTNIPKKEIALRYSITEQSISAFNLGVERYVDGMDYPIRKKLIKEVALNYCPICGKEIWEKSKCCRQCKINFYEGLKIPLPPKEELLKDLYEMRKDYLVAEKYGISTMLLKDWKIKLEIPRKRQLVDKLYEEEYLHIENKSKQKIYLKQWGDIAQIHLETGEILNVFKSAAEACRFLNKNDKDTEPIRKCAKGEAHQAYGFKWKYLNSQ